MFTHDDTLSATQILKLMGGPTLLARHPELDCHRSAIANWSKDGIPARHWPALARIAARDEMTKHITIEALERHSYGAEAKAEAA